MSGKIGIKGDLLVALLAEDNNKIQELRDKNTDVNIDIINEDIRNNINKYCKEYSVEIYRKSYETIDLYHLFFAIHFKDYDKVKELVYVLTEKKIDIDSKLRFTLINLNIFLKLRNSSLKYEEFLDVPIVMYAINRGDKEIVEILLNNGADTSLKYPSFGSLLDYAIKENHNEIIELLFKKNIDFDITSALYTAIRNDNPKLIEILINKNFLKFFNCNSELMYIFGSPLDYSIDTNKYEISKILFEYKVKVNLKEALKKAINHENIKLVELIIDNGLCILKKSIDCSLFLDLSIEKNNYEISKLLIENKIESNLNLLLHKSIKNRNIQLVHLLLSKGATILKSEDNTLLLEDAIYLNIRKILELLVQNGAIIDDKNFKKLDAISREKCLMENLSFLSNYLSNNLDKIFKKK